MKRFRLHRVRGMARSMCNPATTPASTLPQARTDADDGEGWRKGCQEKSSPVAGHPWPRWWGWLKMVDINITPKVPAVEKLLDYVAIGVGATAGKLLAPWCASQEGKARVIAARADAEVQQIQAAQEGGTPQLIKKAQAEAREYVATSDGLEPGGDIRVQEAMEFQAKKRLTNDGAIAGHAAEELGDTEVPDHEPDPDWIARFFDDAQDISSEELQKLWGRILAGEVKSPGQTSLRTLSILRNMTQEEAQVFSDLMRFRISRFIFIEGINKVLNKNPEYSIIYFSDIGLFATYGVSFNIKLGNNGEWVTKHFGHALIIEGPPGQKISMQMGQNAGVITSAGLELEKLCQHEQPDLQYLSHFARFLTEKNCKLKLARAVDLGDQSAFIGVKKVIEPFVEPEDRDQEEPGNAE